MRLFYTKSEAPQPKYTKGISYGLDPELEVQTNLGQPPGSHGARARPKRHGLCHAEDDSNHDPQNFAHVEEAVLPDAGFAKKNEFVTNTI